MDIDSESSNVYKNMTLNFDRNKKLEQVSMRPDQSLEQASLRPEQNFYQSTDVTNDKFDDGYIDSTHYVDEHTDANDDDDAGAKVEKLDDTLTDEQYYDDNDAQDRIDTVDDVNSVNDENNDKDVDKDDSGVKPKPEYDYLYYYYYDYVYPEEEYTSDNAKKRPKHLEALPSPSYLVDAAATETTLNDDYDVTITTATVLPTQETETTFS